jgi:TPR repeat protein
VPADLAGQIAWDTSAITDPLPDSDRTELGLPPDSRTKMTWSSEPSACDRAAAAIYDPDRITPGVSLGNITVDIANAACSAETSKPQHPARSDYQMGRALLVKKNMSAARQAFETAAAKGYRAAGVDLADLLEASAAVPLYRKAWQDGVPVAAFKLGHFYEYGMQGREKSANTAIRPDLSQAWTWYQKGADAGEPNSLARFAERDERNALDETDLSKQTTLLLRAFRYYAAAAERAKDQDWPDDAWRHWRYRRATLARLLAREGLMQRVADTYASIRDKQMLRAEPLAAL